MWLLQASYGLFLQLLYRTMPRQPLKPVRSDQQVFDQEFTHLMGNTMVTQWQSVLQGPGVLVAEILVDVFV